MRLMMLGAVALVLAAAAGAEVKRIDLGGYAGKAVVNSAYRKGNEIRVYVTGSSSVLPQELGQVAIREIAELTKAKGLPRFAVTKISDCGTLRMYNVAVSSSCRLLGRMLDENETATAEGKREVTYFRTDDVLAGRMEPSS